VESASIDPATAQALRTLAASAGATAGTVLLAAFGHLVHQLTGATDIVVGAPAADRRHLEFHDLVGFFIDIIPLRLRVDPHAHFIAAVRAATAELLDALAHPAAPLERIVEALGLPRDPTRSPLVQVLFNVYNFPEPRLSLPGVHAERGQPGMPGSPFDLTCYIVERDGTFAVELLYNTDLFTPGRIRAMLAGYLQLIDQACANPDSLVEAVPLPDTMSVRSGLTGLDPPLVVSANGDHPTVGGRAPVTPTERLLTQVWRDVLGVLDIGVADNFFDIGGTSMAIVAVRDRLTELSGREVSIVDLFRFPNIRMLAGYLDGGTEAQGQDRQGVQRAAARRERMQARGAARQRRHQGDGG
jgi:non-ribosomal peptide synthetase component F